MVIIGCFEYAGKSGVNSGIMASIFSSCVIITPIIFHFKYGQKFSKGDFIGGAFILACIILISTDGGAGSSDIETSSQKFYLAIAVILALLAGMTFSVNTLNIEYIIKKVGFPTSQINVDGNATYGLVLTPLFIYEMCKE